MNPERAIAYRKQVSALLEAVLNDEITPRSALNCWPTYANVDASVECAYTMLWYFESDEERHKTEMYYADLQLKTLYQVSQLLKKGEALPITLIKDYQAQQAPQEYKESHTWQEPLTWLEKHLNVMRGILGTHPWLKQPAKKPAKRPWQTPGPFQKLDC